MSEAVKAVLQSRVSKLKKFESKGLEVVLKLLENWFLLKEISLTYYDNEISAANSGKRECGWKHVKEEKVGKGKWEKGGKPSWKANRERIQVACYLFGEAYEKVKRKEKRRNLRGQIDRERNERKEKWNERKKCSVQTDMEKGIKGRSAFQSRHNVGHCKKQRSDLQWERIRQKRVRSGKGQSGEKALMIKQKNESNRGGIVDNFLSCDHVGCHGA